MDKTDLLIAISLEVPLIWNDPAPIEGNDYNITLITNVGDETCTIKYGEGSEAEVFISEIIKA